jgi:hypothetical protein
MDNIGWEQGVSLSTKQETCKSLLSSNVDLGASRKDGGVYLLPKNHSETSSKSWTCLAHFETNGIVEEHEET